MPRQGVHLVPHRTPATPVAVPAAPDAAPPGGPAIDGSDAWESVPVLPPRREGAPPTMGGWFPGRRPVPAPVTAHPGQPPRHLRCLKAYT
jgi:hypothetical protein